jgi:RNA polymerase sigma-70 factor (ECF subfamily)
MYDPHRSQKNTFIVRIVDHKAASLVQSQRRAKRGFGYCMCSLDDVLSDADEGDRPHSEIVGEDEVFLRTGRANRPTYERADLRLDVTLTVSRLPPRLSRLCRDLQCQNVQEISRETGISRSAIYDGIKRIRRRFEADRLDDYL